MLQAAERHVTDRDVGPNSLWGPVIDGPDLEVMLVGAKTGFDFPELVIPGNNILSIQIVCTMNQNEVKAVGRRERFSYGAFFPIGNFCPV